MSRRRLLLVAVLGLAWIAAISTRLYYLQVKRYDHYVQKAARQQQRVVKLDPPRGTIYDSQGRELAVSVQVDSVWAVPTDIVDPVETARRLAEAIPGLDVRRLARDLDRDREFVWVARKLDPPVAEAVRALREQGKLDGIHFLPESKRYYPMRGLAAQVLGYVGTDNQGLAGLELRYDEQVAGKPGLRTVLRDAGGATVVAPGLSFAEAQPGQDLHLTLDAAVQHIVERELEKSVRERGASRGIAVFLDPRTGGVVAMASYPGFDPNDFDRYPKSQWRNRAIADVYEPGSTFKVVTAAAAIASGMIHPGDVFDCEMGGTVVYGKRIRDHKPFGRLTFAEVLAKSSNVGVIKAALILGDGRLYSMIRGFGFGEPTGIDLPGEGSGIVHPMERWGMRGKAYVSFGQGISVTPLQLARAVAAVANGGTLFRPYVVESVGGGANRVARRLPDVAGRPIDAATARELVRMMEGVVTAGTAKAAGVPGYRVAGKTGTAQIPVAGGYSRNGYLPSFVGFVPADNPVLVGLVAVAEPQGFAYHGGQVAAPLFGEIARQVLLYMGVRPQRQTPELWPGQVPQMVLAEAQPAPAPLPAPGAAVPGGEPPPATAAPATAPAGVPAGAPAGLPAGQPAAVEAESEPATPSPGGRSHASF